MSKVSNLIEKLIQQTENNKIQWKVFDRPDEYNSLASIYDHYSEAGHIINSSSYIAKYKGGTIIILAFTFDITGWSSRTYEKHDVEHLILCVESKDTSKVSDLNSLAEFQADLFRLLNMIDRQVNKVNEFIDDILNDLD